MFGIGTSARNENIYVTWQKSFDCQVAKLAAELGSERAFSNKYDHLLFSQTEGEITLRGPQDSWSLKTKKAPIEAVRDICNRLEVLQQMQIPSLEGGGRGLSLETLLKETTADGSAFNMDQIELRMVAACGLGTLHGARRRQPVELTYGGMVECRPVPYLHEVLQSSVRLSSSGLFKQFVNPDLNAENPRRDYPILAD
jgi:hypothetical protein